MISKLRKITGEKRIGHAGTLDPIASGLLVVAIGREFTKQLDNFRKLDKKYIAELILGKISNTYDSEGEIKDYSDRKVSKLNIEKVLEKFRGKIEQIPPIFSAKKIKGKKAYELARMGKEIKLEPQLINISEIKLLNYTYPLAKIEVKVSSGTYIRSLIHDIGQELKIGAYMIGLTRTEIGEYNLEQAIDLNVIKSDQELASNGKIVK